MLDDATVLRSNPLGSGPSPVGRAIHHKHYAVRDNRVSGGSIFDPVLQAAERRRPGWEGSLSHRAFGPSARPGRPLTSPSWTVRVTPSAAASRASAGAGSRPVWAGSQHTLYPWRMLRVRSKDPNSSDGLPGRE